MIGLPGEHLRRSARWTVALLALLTGVAARAENAPEPKWHLVDLKLEVNAGIAQCPEQIHVAAWVNHLVGREFVVAQAPVEISIRVAQAAGEELVVDVGAVETTLAGVVTRAELRRFQRALPCAELLRAAALTISLFATTPGAEDTEVATEPLSPQTVPVLPPPQAPAPPEPSPSTPQASAPEPFPPPPQASSRLPPSKPLTVTPQPAVSSSAEPPAYSTLSPLIGVSASGALGLNPGVGVGANAHVGLHWPAWDMLIRGGYWASTGRRLEPAEIGTIYGPTSELAVAACPLFALPPLFINDASLRVCGLGGITWVFARGEDFDRNRRVTLTTIVVGASAELLIEINEGVTFGFKLDALVPLAPVRYELAEERSASWSMWSVAPRIALGLEWR